MDEFDDPRIDKLTFDLDVGEWVGTIELPLFAECDQRALYRATRRITQESDGDDGAPGDESNDDRTPPPKQTQLDLYVLDTGCGRITPAQRRTLAYLLEHEKEVLDTILDSLLKTYRSIYNDLREFHGQHDHAGLGELVPEIDDPDGLKELIDFSSISLGGLAVDGYVPITVWGSCTWDEEHGFEIEILKDRAIDGSEESELEPFPYTLPDELELSKLPFDEAGECLVEFRIHGAWTGIYRLSSERQVLGRDRPCLYCKGQCWDAEGIDAIREVPPAHRRISSTPVFVATELSLTGGSCFAPLLLLLGLLAWPGFFWGALLFSAVSVVAWITVPNLPQDYKSNVAGANAVIAALSIAGLVASYGFDAFADISFAAAIGWIIWTGAALAVLFAVGTGATIAVSLGNAMGRSGLVLSLPFLIFAAVVGVAVWKTFTDAFSKFHLLWIVPLSIYLALATGMSAALAQLNHLRKQLDDDTNKRRGSQVVDAEVERKPKRRIGDESSDDEA